MMSLSETGREPSSPRNRSVPRQVAVVVFLLAIGLWFTVREFEPTTFERAQPPQAGSLSLPVIREEQRMELKVVPSATAPQISLRAPSALCVSKGESRDNENVTQAPEPESQGENEDEEEEKKPRIGVARFTYDGAFGYSYENKKDRHAYAVKYFSEQELADQSMCLCVIPTDNIGELEPMMREVVDVLQKTKIKGLVFLGDGYGSHRGTWHQREAEQLGRNLQIVEQLKEYPGLEVLVLDGLDGLYPVTIKDSDLKALRELHSLRVLSLSGFILTESTIDTIVSLTSLEELNLAWCSSEVHGEPENWILSRFSSLVNLRGLNLEDCNIDGLDDYRSDDESTDDGEWRRLEFLSSLNRLERLNLSSLNSLRDHDLKYVASLKSLKHFRLRGSSHISDEALAEALVPLRNLEIIETSGLSFMTPLCLFVKHLSNPEKVTRLEVGNFSLESEFFPFLDSLSRFRNLQELAIAYTGVGWSYIELLEELPVDRLLSLDQLRSLGIAFGLGRDSPGEKDDCFRFFSSRYYLSRLETLSISGDGISDASVPYILSLPSLRWIDVSDTGISEAGVKSMRARGLEVVDGRD